MPREPGGEGRKAHESKEPVSAVDALIAEAEAAALVAQREATQEETGMVKAKKTVSAETAARAELLQQTYAAMKADDAFVEDYKFEEIWEAGETETGVAAPEKIQEALAALRKTGEALRKLALIDPKTKALHAKMEELHVMHDKLFDKVQTATVDALDAIKKKHKGEETAFERRYKQLTESPLVRGIEFDQDSPEAREKAAKHEIVEFILRPLVEGGLMEMKKRLAQARAENVRLESAQDRGSHTSDAINARGNVRSEISTLEKRLVLEPLAIEINRTLLETVLQDVHDEAMLHDARIDLRRFLDGTSKHLNDQGDSLRLYKGDVLPLEHPLAKKILTAYVRYGAALSNVDIYRTSSPFEDTEPVAQLLRTGQNHGYAAKQHVRKQTEGVVLDDVGRLINLEIAYKKLHKGLGGRTFQSGFYDTQLTPAAVEKGWKESKLGAWVEPGQSIRAVDADFARLLERLSQPQVEAERAFDVRGPEGEFHVYTTEQAVNLLRRARRDARAIIQDADRTVLEAKRNADNVAFGQRQVYEDREGLAKEKTRLREQAEEDKKTAQKDLEKRWKEKMDGEAWRAADTEREMARLKAQVAAYAKTLKQTREGLNAALEKKPGMFGGDKELRATATNILEHLEEAAKK